MMGHVLLIEDSLVFGNWPRQPAGHLAPIVLLMTNNLITAGMGDLRLHKVMRVEGLVADECIRPIAPRTHQRRGDVAWSRPHGDTQRLVVHCLGTTAVSLNKPNRLFDCFDPFGLIVGDGDMKLLL